MELYEVALILVMFNLIFYIAYAVYLRNTSVKDDRNEKYFLFNQLHIQVQD